MLPGIQLIKALALLKRDATHCTLWSLCSCCLCAKTIDQMWGREPGTETFTRTFALIRVFVKNCLCGHNFSIPEREREKFHVILTQGIHWAYVNEYWDRRIWVGNGQTSRICTSTAHWTVHLWRTVPRHFFTLRNMFLHINTLTLDGAFKNKPVGPRAIA